MDPNTRSATTIVDDRNLGDTESITVSSKGTHTFPDKCPSHESNGDNSRLIVDKPHAHDILFARGNGVNRHIGNVFLRQLAMQRKHHHKEGTHPSQILIVAYDIFGEIKKLDPPGRFLMQTPYDCSKWYDVSDSNAVREICNLLRELSNEELAITSAPTNSIPSDTLGSHTQHTSTSSKYVDQDDASIHSHNTHGTSSSNISRLLSSAAMIDQSQIKLLNDLKKAQVNINNSDRNQGIGRSGEDKAALELLQRYQNLSGKRIEANGVKSSNIDKNLSNQLAPRSKAEEYNVMHKHQIISSQMPMMQEPNIRPNIPASNAHLLNHMLDSSGKVDYATGQAKPDEKHQPPKQNVSSSLEQKSDNKKTLSGKRHKVSLPKIDNDELSVHSNQLSVYSNQHSIYSNATRRNLGSKTKSEVKTSALDDTSKANKKIEGSKRQKPSSSSDSIKETKSAKKDSDQHHHQQVIMPLSYIGHSFMNSPDCSSESKSVFEEIAFLGQR